MGHTWIAGILETEAVDTRTALSLHFRCNTYPPVHEVFIDSALAAIEHCRDEEWDELIELPNGNILTAGKIVSQLHLDAFLESEG